MTPGQSSFRRILLSRILLVSVPVLLIGVYVTYQKARSAFLETARQNLTESAIRKGEIVSKSTQALRHNLASASDAIAVQIGITDPEVLIGQLNSVLPADTLCAQITDLKTNQAIAGNCKEAVELESDTWQKKQEQILTVPSQVKVKLLLPSTSLSRDVEEADENPLQRQLKLWLTAPVYDRNGDLRYALSVKSAIVSQEIIEPGSLEGYPVVIDEDGTILAHPFIARVGRNIKQMPDAERLSELMVNAIANKPDSLHLFYLETDGVELVAGYSSISSPVTSNDQEKWIILAVSPINTALEPLKDIRRALVGMTLGLILASSLATIFLSRELARPLERIRDYSLKKEHLQSAMNELSGMNQAAEFGKQPQRLSEDFKIREFNQLSEALNEMVSHLKAWGEEIVSAWKEAQAANQLKSEFLATTSHELRTPLNGIINCIRIVRDGYCDSEEEEREFLQQADDAAIHLLGIINDVLDISKIEAGKLSVAIDQVDLKKIINEVIDLQLVDLQHKDVKLNLPEWREDISVLADSAKLKQVLINVVSNAVKFTDYGSISINVAVKTELSPLAVENYEHLLAAPQAVKALDGDRSQTEIVEELIMSDPNFYQSDYQVDYPQKVVITIKDTGIGIEKSQQQKLFNPFVMVDGSTTRKFGGTGLGLAISRNLIELMKGTISLYSGGEGEGTTVEISLPLGAIQFNSEAATLPTANS